MSSVLQTIAMALILKNRSILNAFFKNCASTFSVSTHLMQSKRESSSEAVSTNVSVLENEDDELLAQHKERRIEKIRNVSRLNPQHRNMVHEQVPFPTPKADLHLTVKYRRKMYGKYGSVSGVNPGIMWPTKKDIKERQEYEKVAYPFTIQDMVKAELSKKEAEEAEIWEQQKKIGENFQKLNKWIDDLESKRAKKIKVAAEAKAKKDRLVEEVRRHFGYTVDHRDEKFQLMLEQKEKEEKKLLKIERKKKREEMLMQDLLTASHNIEKK